MSLRERFRDEKEKERQNPSPGSPASSDLDKLRQEAEGFLTAGDAAINQALSGNSEAFLAANRQQGGQ